MPGFFLASLLILVLLGVGVIPSTALTRALDAAARPLWQAEDFVGSFFDGIGTALSSKETLARENSELEDTILALEARDAGIGSLENENATLLNALGRAGGTAEIVAAIIVRPPLSPNDTIVVDAGEENGAAVGDRVVVSGAALGTVTAVSARSAIVKLYSAPGNQFEALVGSSTASVEAKGLGGGMMGAEVPKGFPVSVGEPVIVPSLAPSVYGLTGSVSADAQDAFSTVLFRSPINLSQLRLVEIIP